MQDKEELDVLGIKTSNKEELDILDIVNDKEELIDIAAEAKRLLMKSSKLPTKWNDIFNAIEVFRKKVQAGRDSYDSTANDSQVGLMSPMLVMFALMLETNMIMEPLDTNIIINILSDNFKDKRQVEKLKDLLNQLHPKQKEFINERKKYRKFT